VNGQWALGAIISHEVAMKARSFLAPSTAQVHLKSMTCCCNEMSHFDFLLSGWSILCETASEINDVLCNNTTETFSKSEMESLVLIIWLKCQTQKAGQDGNKNEKPLRESGVGSAVKSRKVPGFK
jgi:hypothetical protein